MVYAKKRGNENRKKEFPLLLDKAHQDAILSRPAKVVHEHGPIYVLEWIAGWHIVGHWLVLRDGI